MLSLSVIYFMFDCNTIYVYLYFLVTSDFFLLSCCCYFFKRYSDFNYKLFNFEKLLCKRIYYILYRYTFKRTKTKKTTIMGFDQEMFIVCIILYTQCIGNNVSNLLIINVIFLFFCVRIFIIINFPLYENIKKENKIHIWCRHIKYT